MGDKETKLFLKDALENIKKKDFDKALKDVKKVLNKDKNNYKALIFCGLCLAELDQHEKALQVLYQCGVPRCIFQVLDTEPKPLARQNGQI